MDYEKNIKKEELIKKIICRFLSLLPMFLYMYPFVFANTMKTKAESHVLDLINIIIVFLILFYYYKNVKLFNDSKNFSYRIILINQILNLIIFFNLISYTFNIQILIRIFYIMALSIIPILIFIILLKITLIGQIFCLISDLYNLFNKKY